MNKYRLFCIFGILSILCIQIISAVPRIEPYVNDFANVLTSEEEQSLNLQADAIEQNTTVEIAIVTVQNTEGQDRLTYAAMIGDESGVGKLNNDNGVIVLWSEENERGGAIAIGRGIESILNDAKVTRMGRDYRPLMDDGRFYEAFSGILTEINTELTPTNSSGQNTNFNLDFNWWIILLPFAFMIFFWLIKFLWPEEKKGYKYKRFRKNEEDEDDDVSTAVLVGTIAASSEEGDSSHSSSGPSFGGGSFGGGGGKF